MDIEFREGRVAHSGGHFLSPQILERVRVMRRQITAIVEREGDGYVSLCPELDIASQGSTIEEARSNLREAVDLFFETASPQEIGQRLHDEVYVTRLEVGVG
jgi:predicted RNase H-like HicB family nuclease